MRTCSATMTEEARGKPMVSTRMPAPQREMKRPAPLRELHMPATTP